MPSKEDELWISAAKRMRRQLEADRRNHEMLADPWGRAAHTMQNGWRIRLSQRGLRRPRKPRAPATTWEEAAKRMQQSLASRARMQALKGTWRYWARTRPPLSHRYVRKSARPVGCQ